jgi:hypothetical protein
MLPSPIKRFLSMIFLLLNARLVLAADPTCTAKSNVNERISIPEGCVTVTTAFFSNIASADNGGAIYVSHWLLESTVTETTFSECRVTSSTKAGGGCYLGCQSNVLKRSCFFSCLSEGAGQAVYFYFVYREAARPWAVDFVTFRFCGVFSGTSGPRGVCSMAKVDGGVPIPFIQTGNFSDCEVSDRGCAVDCADFNGAPRQEFALVTRCSGSSVSYSERDEIQGMLCCAFTNNSVTVACLVLKQALNCTHCIFANTGAICSHWTGDSTQDRYTECWFDDSGPANALAANVAGCHTNAITAAYTRSAWGTGVCPLVRRTQTPPRSQAQAVPQSPFARFRCPLP